MTHAFSVNAVCISRNGKCIYAYKASGYRGHAFKRSFQRVAKSVNGRSPRLMHLTSWHAQLLSQSGALAGVDTARQQPLRARCRPSRPSSATGVAAPSLRAAGAPLQAREMARQRRCRPPRDETPGCTPHQDHADRMGPPISPPLLPEISVYIHQHIRPCATQAT